MSAKSRTAVAKRQRNLFLHRQIGAPFYKSITSHKPFSTNAENKAASSAGIITRYWNLLDMARAAKGVA